MIRLILIFIFLAFYATSFFSQSHTSPSEIPEYDFIHYDKNRFIFSEDSSAYRQFMEKYTHLIREGEGQLSVVHIGGSHLQADIYSDRIRSRLQTLEQGNNGGRGFIFPYEVGSTNNPSNFRVKHTGHWESCRNVEKKKDCILGLSGISVSTSDTNSSITVTFPESNEISYDFKRVSLFYLDDRLSFDVSVRTSEEIRKVDKQAGYRTWYLDGHADSLVIMLSRSASVQERFTLFGISLETDDPGMIYHAIGVNGAKLPSFLRCSLLPLHLQALSPDLVVLSLGTNDANNRYFNAKNYRQDYDSLIYMVRQALPDAAILLTVPNDSYLYRRYLNRNTEKVKNVILELGRDHHCGVWDFYSIMGGLNSIIVWQQFGLASGDRIHFTRKGYMLMGDLFFNAFLKSYNNYLDTDIGFH